MADQTNTSTEDRDGEIARLAHGIWESEGRPHGRDREHWMRAEQLAGNDGPTEPGMTSYPKTAGAPPPRNDEEAVADGLEQDPAPDDSYVRPAGRREMDLPHGSWTKTDEESDESFPASDPPANY